jgi:hypothetical protein
MQIACSWTPARSPRRGPFGCVRASRHSPQSQCPVQPGFGPRLRAILAHLKHASGGRLDLCPDAPSRYKGTGERRIGEVDRKGVIQHAETPGGRHRSPVRAAVLIELCGDLRMPLAETRWRNGDADTDREPPFGRRDQVGGIAGHLCSLLVLKERLLTGPASSSRLGRCPGLSMLAGSLCNTPAR